MRECFNSASRGITGQARSRSSHRGYPVWSSLARQSSVDRARAVQHRKGAFAQARHAPSAISVRPPNNTVLVATTNERGMGIENSPGRCDEKTAQNASGPIFSRRVATWVSPFFEPAYGQRVVHTTTLFEHVRRAEDAVAAAVPVDVQNAPQGTAKNAVSRSANSESAAGTAEFTGYHRRPRSPRRKGLWK